MKVGCMKKIWFAFYFISNFWGASTFNCYRIRFVLGSSNTYGKLLDDVYVRSEVYRNARPVFESENTDAHFWYNLNRDWYLSQGSLDNFTGLYAVTASPLKYGKKDVPIKYCERSNKNSVCIKLEDVATNAQIKCVGSMVDCQDKSLIWNSYDHKSRTKVRKIFIKRFQGDYYSSDRTSVLKKNGSLWYMENKNPYSKFRYIVYSNFSKPELITENWENDISVTLQCVGDESSQCHPPAPPCQNSGVCHRNDEGQSWCSCKQGYNGSHCEQTELGVTKTTTSTKATHPRIASSTQSYMRIRSSPRRPSHYQPSPQPTEETLDNNKGKKPLLVLLVLIPLVIFPCLHLRIFYYLTKKRPNIVRVLSMHAYGGKRIIFVDFSNIN